MRTGDQVVQELPWRWRAQGMIFLVGGLGFMFDAWDVILNGFLIPLVSDEWGLTKAEGAWVGTANLIGMAIGAFVWGGIADIIGRKRAFSLTLLMFSVFSVAGAMAPRTGRNQTNPANPHIGHPVSAPKRNYHRLARKETGVPGQRPRAKLSPGYRPGTQSTKGKSASAQ